MSNKIVIITVRVFFQKKVVLVVVVVVTPCFGISSDHNFRQKQKYKQGFLRSNLWSVHL